MIGRPRLRLVALVAGLAIMLAGCELRFDETTTVNDDGSGEIALVVALDEELRELVESQSGEDIDFTDPESWDQTGDVTTALPPDVEYTIDPYLVDDFEGFLVKLGFDSPNQLAGWAESAGDQSGIFPVLEVSDGRYRIEYRIDLDDVTDQGQEELGADLSSIIEVRLSASLPGELVETNGEVDEEGTIRWEPNLVGPGAGTVLFVETEVPTPSALPLVAAGAAILLILGLGAAQIAKRRRPADTTELS